MSAPLVVDRSAEQAVLGALLIYGEPRHVTSLVRQGLRSEHFYWETHGAVFQASVTIAERDGKIDPVTVSAELARIGRQVSRGDIDYLAGCVPAAGHLSEYAKLVRDLALWRDRLSATRDLLSAVQRREQDSFDDALKRLRPARQPQAAASAAAPRLRLVVDGDTGEVVEESRHCPRCQSLQDELDGAAKDIKAWRTRHAELKRRIDDAARADGLWQTAAELFAVWKRMCNHPRSEFTEDRFYAVIPFLRHRRYGPVVCERAIAGIAFDPFTVVMKNGRTKRYDEWERVFKCAGKLEEYANRAPLDWKPTLRISAAPISAVVAAERSG